MKGILMEKGRRKSVVMDKSGRFIKTRTVKKWNEGDEVVFISNSVKLARRVSVLVVFSLVFALGIFAAYAANSYTVNLDVNPSIKIEVNAFNTVVDIKAMNDEAQKIGDLTMLIGTKVGFAVNEAILMLLADGFLEEDGTVVLSIEGKNNKVKIVTREVAEAVADAVVENEDDEIDADEIKLKIYVGRITEEMALAAEELGVPYGRIVLAAKAQEEGTEITYDMAAVLSIQEIQQIRNISKTINKATELLKGTAEAGQEEGGNKLKQVEALNKKILKGATKIEESILSLEGKMTTGETDDETRNRFAVLTIQLQSITLKMEQMGVVADAETEEIINGMMQIKGADAVEKARIREEIKLAKEAEQDAKKEEIKTRIEEKMETVREKVAALKIANGMTNGNSEKGKSGGSGNN